MRSALTTCLLWGSIGFVGSVCAEDPAPEGRLELWARVTVHSSGDLEAVAEFRNTGTASLTFFVPEFAQAQNFPGWRFVRQDGTALVPYAAPFQSMWTVGDQGALVRVLPGKSWSLRNRLRLFVPEGESGLTPLPLDAGLYRVECAYEQADATIPVGKPGFEVGRRPVAGLWTGRVAAPPTQLAAPRAAIVSLRIDAPGELAPGAPYLLTVTVSNDTQALASVPGVLTITAASKPRGVFTARVILDDPPRAARPGELQTLGLLVGTVQRHSVDLGALTFQGSRPGSAPQRLADALGEGVFALSASFGHADEAARLDSNGLWRRVTPATADTAPR